MLNDAEVKLLGHLVAHAAGCIDDEGDVRGIGGQADGREVFVFEALKEASGFGGGLLAGTEVGLFAVEFLLQVGKRGFQLLDDGLYALPLLLGLLAIDRGFEEGGFVGDVCFELRELRSHGLQCGVVDFAFDASLT